MKNIVDYYDRLREELTELKEKERITRDSIINKTRAFKKAEKKLHLKTYIWYIKNNLNVGDKHEVIHSVSQFSSAVKPTIITIYQFNKNTVQVLIDETKEKKSIEYNKLFYALGCNSDDAIKMYRTYINRDKVLSELLGD